MLQRTDRGFLISPDLPSGLSLDADSGVINGVPARATEEPQKFTVHVDAGIDSPALELQLSIVVSPAPGASWSSWIVTALSICAPLAPTLWQQCLSATGCARCWGGVHLEPGLPAADWVRARPLSCLPFRVCNRRPCRGAGAGQYTAAMATPGKNGARGAILICARRTHTSTHQRGLLARAHAFGRDAPRHAVAVSSRARAFMKACVSLLH